MATQMMLMFLLKVGIFLRDNWILINPYLRSGLPFQKPGKKIKWHFKLTFLGQMIVIISISGNNCQ